MLKPVQDKVYIAPIFDATKTASGLYIPDEARERCDQGIVKFVGPDCQHVKVGDYVLFPNYCGTLMEIDKVMYIIMREDFVTARLQHGNPVIPGLYLKGMYSNEEHAYNYFPATFESVFQLVTELMSTHPLFVEIREKKDKRQINER